MYRAAVLGTSGAGKTTVAASLARIYDVPHIDLDDLALGWEAAPDETFRARVSAVLGTPGWVIDGDYQRKLDDLVLSRADEVVWLDLPLRVSLARMWRRTAGRIREREKLAYGKTLTWNLSLLLWLAHEVRSHVRRRFFMSRRLSANPGLHVVHLRTQAQVDEWLASQPPGSRVG